MTPSHARTGDEVMQARQRRLEILMHHRMRITPEGFRNLDSHKFKRGEYGPIENLLDRYFWVPLSEKLPKNIAPNIVTLTGLVFGASGIFLCVFLSGDFRHPVPRWANILSILGILIYQTLDALDGKQARRTGSSSPLGELFDHGCDGFMTSLGALNYCTITMSGYSFHSFLWVGMCLIQFFTCALVEYHTGVLPTTSCGGWLGAVELHYGGIMLIALTLVDPDFFSIELSSYVVPSWWCGESTCTFRVRELAFAALFFFASCSLGSLFCMILREEHVNKVVVMKQIFPIVLHVSFGLVWVLVVPPVCTKLALFLFVLPMNCTILKLIVAAMNHMSYQAIDLGFVLYPILLVIIKLDIFPDCIEVLMGAYFAYCMMDMARYINEIVQELCHWFNIHWYKLGSRGKVD